MYKFTVFCQSESGGTIHISTVVADTDNAKDAAVVGRAVCANDWECSPNAIRVLMVVEGFVSPCLWDDDGLELPAHEELTEIRVEFEPWPGCPFTGSYTFAIAEEDFNEEGLRIRLSDIEDLLQGLADDDPMGTLLERIEQQVRAMITLDDVGGKPSRHSIVSPSGRYKTDDRGVPELYSGTSSPVLDESFDISVWIIPVFRDETE